MAEFVTMKPSKMVQKWQKRYFCSPKDILSRFWMLLVNNFKFSALEELKRVWRVKFVLKRLKCKRNSIIPSFSVTIPMVSILCAWLLPGNERWPQPPLIFLRLGKRMPLVDSSDCFSFDKWLLGCSKFKVRKKKTSFNPSHDLNM